MSSRIKNTRTVWLGSVLVASALGSGMWPAQAAAQNVAVPTAPTAAAATMPARAGAVADATQDDAAILADPSKRQIVGDVKAVAGRTVTISRGGAYDFTVMIPAGATLVAVDPGTRDLKGAAPMAVSELRPGDTLDVRGVLSDDNTAIVASVVLVTRAAMKPRTAATKTSGAGAAGAAAAQPGPDPEQVRVDWQKRGVGGTVTDVDRQQGLVKISTAVANGKRAIITVHNNRDTVLRRYAADSVKLADDVPGTFVQIQVGDELQARGAHSRDGRDLTADEIVFGSFRNISGTVGAVDLVNGTVTVIDRATQQPVEVQITGRSQIRKLPVFAARDIALRLKAAVAPAPGSIAKGAASALVAAANSARGDAQADFEQAVSHIPDARLGDLEQGGAVMVVATASGDGQMTAAIVIGGVEPIVTGALDGTNSLSIAPWNLGTATGDDAPVANP